MVFGWFHSFQLTFLISLFYDNCSTIHSDLIDNFPLVYFMPRVSNRSYIPYNLYNLCSLLDSSHGCSVTVSELGSEIVKLSSNSGSSRNVHFRTNILESIFLLPSLGYIKEEYSWIQNHPAVLWGFGYRTGDLIRWEGRYMTRQVEGNFFHILWSGWGREIFSIYSCIMR